MINGEKIFQKYGVHNREFLDYKTDISIISRWRIGRTGVPIVDAIMRELNVTGFISNGARWIAANYLTIDLKQDWRYGATYFEEKLIDHNVHCNFGSWHAAVGLGSGTINRKHSL
jgi:deoxyribodipyrimidine photo-lyase